ncbi:cation:proton antiporter [Corynebacterium yudongzhengii]|uniref:Monovalent cation/H+ antiporter subunit D family protein n=1 Tax=Corynebacterium yudongzhengii TaxID=2080740 RepID=A0A2U1T5E4_9CORY|nr:monovalent cation/H+ antiporter subunit D family protein [Corynebacterium yudongzhengii]AWB81073.1 cation:proton antiporter [Corynebacterium yudongzhengii]PWC01234.1 monovalent cation/H+ antiporter subunit D family protein [Corynebacterium yudongzhengii]
MNAEVTLPLFVATPLILAAVAVISPWKILRDILHIAVPVVGIVAGGWLFAYTAMNGTIAHTIGLYPAGVGITYAADQFSALMIVTTMIVAATANWFATATGETNSRFYASLTLILVTGVNGALLTADLFNFFVMIEVMLLPSYGLVAMTGGRNRLRGARVFILTNLAASTLLLVGVGFVYGVTGAVNIAALAGVGAAGGPALVALGLVVIAIITKAGIFPVHTWLPRTYPLSSAAVMGLFSGLHTKVAVYMLFRIFVVIFDLDDRFTWLITILMVVSMILGAFAGLAEHTIRRVLAYQMVTGMPFILVMFAFAPDNPHAALSAGIVYTLHHMITIGALILNAGAIEETYGTGRLARLTGLAHRHPWTAAIFAAGAYSVVGFPPFSGLWGKVLLVIAAAEPGDMRSVVVITAIIVASFGALLAMLRVWRKVFWGRPMRGVPAGLRIRKRLLAPSAALMVISAGMFVAAGPLIDAVHTATDQLLNVEAYTAAVLGDDAVGVVDPENPTGGNR